MTLSIEASPSGAIAVIHLIGPHDLATGPEVRRALLSPVCLNAGLVVIDLAGCTLLDSTSMGLLVSASKRLAGRQTRLIAVNATGIVASALRITGIDQLLRPTTAQDEDDYLEALIKTG